MSAPPPRPTKTAAKPWLKGQTDDLASLANLDENILLDELKARYAEDKIYVSPFRHCLGSMSVNIAVLATATGSLLSSYMSLADETNPLLACLRACVDVCGRHSCCGESIQATPAIRSQGACTY
jgi:hypothetical protein